MYRCRGATTVAYRVDQVPRAESNVASRVDPVRRGGQRVAIDPDQPPGTDLDAVGVLQPAEIGCLPDRQDHGGGLDTTLGALDQLGVAAALGVADRGDDER